MQPCSLGKPSTHPPQQHSHSAFLQQQQQTASSAVLAWLVLASRPPDAAGPAVLAPIDDDTGT